MTNAELLIEFIKKCPTCFNVIDQIKVVLDNNGYKKLDEQGSFVLNLGEKYYVTRNDSSLIAFNIGKELDENYAFNIVASHSDSPCFKLKPICDYKTDIYNKVSVEPYGGMINSTWLDRPLSVAGRVVVRNGDKLITKIIDIKEPVLLIPNLCVHFNRTINDGYKYDYDRDMQPFVSQEISSSVVNDILCKYLNINENDIIGFDLYAYVAEKGTLWGVNKEYILSPRLDDQECVYTSLRGLLTSYNPKNINVFAVFDNEEVGSSTRQGANSDFLYNTLIRINAGLKNQINRNFASLIASSFMVSADNAHAVHPCRIDVTDQLNKVYMNKGIVIKFNASQSYTSDAYSASIVKQICQKLKIPYQVFTNKSGMRGGSTLGNISNSQVSIKSVDIGLAQLAMHSAMECAGAIDVDYMIEFFKGYYSTNITFVDNEIHFEY